ncbi:hypothetical protein [Pyrobaculum neutrophilum]|uniref:Uncharacterized protein n=1 Tax=Pyrobaculum neutrophilum (strain DSM 2338 / JCM 9278 / NBRC 100436 / V24Sta) TaxID=444157 RepID=B1YC66_PYRNV|nr:hypothetical protein [Pyrobaculum neutrophilum]ACB40920.1 conserved hypothetical protein [Pyrobaculum neutrophilum V24Sta]
MGTCTVVWRGEKYRVECSPSHLLSVATKIAEAECIPYFEVYRWLLTALDGRYRTTADVVNRLLTEK